MCVTDQPRICIKNSVSILQKKKMIQERSASRDTQSSESIEKEEPFAEFPNASK